MFLAAFAWAFGERLLFRPPDVGYSLDAPGISRIPVDDGEAIAVLWSPVPNARFVVLYCHGNAEDLGGVRTIVEAWNALGHSVLAFDYAGYGHSDGTPSEAHAIRDAEAAFDHLVDDLGIDPDRIIVVGRSLGGGPALAVAERRQPAAVVLESTFTSANRVLTRVPLLPFDRFPNLTRITSLSVPVVVVHGDADRVVPFHHGRALYVAAPGPKRIVAVPGAGHSDLHAPGRGTLNRVAAALQAVLPGDR